MINGYKILVGRMKGRDHAGDFRRMILKWILKMYGVKMWTGLMWLRMGSNGRLL
jgi:hypothetical protein